MGNDMPRRFSNCLNTGKIRNITCKEELKAGQGMDREKRMRAWIRAEVMLLFIMMGAFLLRETGRTESMEQAVVTATSAAGKDYIKWVDFTGSYEALCQAYDWDVDTFDTEHHVEWIPLLAYTAARTGGEFDKKALKILNETAEKLAEGEAEIETLTKDMKYYPYYLEAYSAALGGLVGEYEAEVIGEDGQSTWQKKYGLKGYCPIARGFDYTHYDDFGAGRSYGYKRRHLGHDMMGLVGVPIIAVESGTVEALGWNQYGGWRLGIRSFDKKRYYYYAHLRKNYPYHKALKEGSIVQAGDVIGYLGRTGYSRTENTNNIDEPHLHFGLQLIFDESQKDGNNEIWIDCYQLVQFLQLNRSETKKDPETKEYSRVLEMRDPAIP